MILPSFRKQVEESAVASVASAMTTPPCLSFPKAICIALLFFFLLPQTKAQQEPALSTPEVELLRETAPDPPRRTLAFVTFLDDRTQAITKLSPMQHRPGRDQDIHDLMEQFTFIAGDFQDNLDDYSKRHKDVRKSLPKVAAAAERWATALKTPPDNEAYNVSRRLALEALKDIQDSIAAMIAEQKSWFLAHPPPKDNTPQGRG